MAEALLKRLASSPGAPEVEVKSAGVAAADGLPASPHAVSVMRERGINLADHRSRRLSADLVEWADIVLTMTESQKSRVASVFGGGSKVFTLNEYAFPGAGRAEIEDPWGRPVETYDRVARDIETALAAALERMRREAAKEGG
jgi:protein-tyrosine phosphatase